MTAPTQDAPQKITKVEELVALLDLADIRCYHVSATNGDGPSTRKPGEEIAVRTRVGVRPAGVAFRLDVRVPLPDGEARADVAAIYTAPHPFDAPRDVIVDFGDNVAVMAAFPFVRQIIADASERVGAREILPMIQRGQVTFAPSVTPAAED